MKKVLAAVAALVATFGLNLGASADPVDPNTLAPATVTLSPSSVAPGDTVTVTVDDKNGNLCYGDASEDSWVISLSLIDKLTYSPMNVAEQRVNTFYHHGQAQTYTFTFVMPPLNSADNPAGPAEFQTYTYKTICWIGLTEPYTGVAPANSSIRLVEKTEPVLAETGTESNGYWFAWLISGLVVISVSYLRVSRKH